MTRTIRCTLSEGGTVPAELPTEQRERTPWIDRWTFERGGKRYRVAVIPLGPWRDQELPWTVAPGGVRIQAVKTISLREGGGTVRLREELPPIDPREWIESLGDAERWPAGTEFEVVIEEVTT
ncbi:MAG TPA: hypothetical protein VFU97_24565 [Xanthobacteraceae bacterium]|nr:hypothetical protein [Xanthobacteraceae bacterium]